MDQKNDKFKISKDTPEDFFKVVSGILSFIENADKSKNDKN